MGSVKVSIEVVAAAGEPRVVESTVNAEGDSVEKTLRAAGLNPKNRDILMNGRPVEPSEPVTAAEIAEASKRGKPLLTLSERPQGS